MIFSFLFSILLQVLITPLTPQQTCQAEKVLHQLASESYFHSGLAESLEQGMAYSIAEEAADPIPKNYYAIESNARVVGYLIVQIYESNTLFLTMLWVDPMFRGQGVGKNALRQLEELAESQSMEWITLCVFDYNTVARKLYESQGYLPMKKDNESYVFTRMRKQIASKSSRNES